MELKPQKDTKAIKGFVTRSNKCVGFAVCALAITNFFCECLIKIKLKRKYFSFPFPLSHMQNN